MSNPPSDIYKQLVGDPQALAPEQQAILDSIPIRQGSADALAADKPVAKRYSIDADPDGIRALTAAAIHGALAFGFQGVKPPPEGHWLTMFWQMGRDALAAQPAASRVFLVATGETADGQETYTRHEGAPPPLCDFETLYTAAQPARAGGDAPIPEECPHLIFYADDDKQDELFAGAGARPNALKRFEQISERWIAYLFVLERSNSRATAYPSAFPSRAALAAAPQPAAAEPAGGVADELAKHLRAAHAFIENTDAFGRTASRGILDCGGCIWNVDESKAALSRHETGARATQVEQPAASTVPAGWKLVPLEPTREMDDAGYATLPNRLGHIGYEVFRIYYRAMLAAAPAAPAAVEREATGKPPGFDALMQVIPYLEGTHEISGRRRQLARDLGELRTWLRAHGIGSSKEGGSSSTGGGE